MGGKRKKSRRNKSHVNKYNEYSKAEKIMERQIDKEIKNYKTMLESTIPESTEESFQGQEYDEYDISYYKDIESYAGEIRRGEIYFFDKGPKVGVEQQGGRPGIIVSNNLCNKHSEFVEVVYTTCQPKTELPTHVTINSTPKPCIALCEQVHTLSKKKIRCYCGEITAEEEYEINKALIINLSLMQEMKCGNDYKEENEQLKLHLDAALEANEGYELEVKQLTQEIVDLTKRIDTSPITEGSIYKKLYYELLDKLIK